MAVRKYILLTSLALSIQVANADTEQAPESGKHGTQTLGNVLRNLLDGKDPKAVSTRKRIANQADAEAAIDKRKATPPSQAIETVVDGVMIRFTSPQAKARSRDNQPPPLALLNAVENAAGTGIRFHRAMSMDMFVFRFKTPLSYPEALLVIDRLKRLKEVDVVEADSRAQAHFMPYDPLNENLHNMGPSTFFGGGIDAELAWDITWGSASTVVAVLDTGLTSHPEFADRLLPGYDFISEAWSANDGNGRDADPSDPGDWVSTSEAAQHPNCPSHGSSWHGTHVTGIIAAKGNNGIGIAGVNWNTKILPVRVLGKCGGNPSDITDGMLWAAGVSVPGVPNNPNPAHIINISLTWKSPSGCSYIDQQAIQQAKAKGALIVVAAGNDNVDAATAVPASCEGVVTVGSVDLYGYRASYSNYSQEYKVAVSAPGGDISFYGQIAGILSTINAGTTRPTYPDYTFNEGTSMAAPHVAGIASLALAENPNLSPQELSALLQATSLDFPLDSACNLYWPYCGSGVANAYSMVLAAKLLAPYAIVSEFYNPDYGHYFRTGGRLEPGVVESGVAGNWRNTEDYFVAWRESTPERSPVCRFYSYVFNSHFYTASPAECEIIKNNTDWTFENIAFYVKRPSNGVCPADTMPIHRFYNNRHMFGDGNHRFTAYKDYYYDAMIQAGWLYEGVKMCAVESL